MQFHVNDCIQEKVRSVRKRYKKGFIMREDPFNLTIDSLANAINNLAEYRLSLKDFPPAPNHSTWFQCPTPGPSGNHHLHPKKTVLPIPEWRQAPQDQLLNGAKRAKPTQRQKGDEDTSKPAVHKHNLHRLSTQSIACATQLVVPSPVQSTHGKRKKTKQGGKP